MDKRREELTNNANGGILFITGRDQEGTMILVGARGEI